MNNSEFLIKTLLANGITKVFTYPGGTIAPLYNACNKFGIKIETFKSEQGALYAAMAASRISKSLQIAMVTSGPGVTNALTPLADAFYDSTPILLITGQIGTGDLKSGRDNIRQRGFQECPTVDLCKPISKLALILDKQEEIYNYINLALNTIFDKRLGPVVLDFPMDIQRAENPYLTDKEISITTKSLYNNHLQENSSKIYNLVKNSYKPLILLGHGALDDAEFEDYKYIAKKLGAIVVNSLMGLGSFDTKSNNYLGYIGHTGHYSANLAFQSADLIIVLGSRLDVRQTGTQVKNVAPNAKKIWVDIDINEIENPRIDIDLPINSSVTNFCKFLTDNVLDLLEFNNERFSVNENWRNKFLELKIKSIEDSEILDDGLSPKLVIQTIDDLIQNNQSNNFIIVTGVGCHQHWAARHFNFYPNKIKFLTSGGHGTMGYDLPTAIGASLFEPESEVILIVGDGSMLMNIQELASLNERCCNIKIIVFNNSRLGIVSQFQLYTWGDDPTTGIFNKVNFCEIAKGFGISSDLLSKSENIVDKINWVISQKGPVLLDVEISHSAEIVPMLMGGQNMDQMWLGNIKI